jgi:hypothetical protein
MGMHMNIRNTAAPALILALLVSLGSAFAATPDAAADNPQCAKYGHTKGTRIGERRTPEPNASDAAYCYCDVVYPEYQCGRCGEAWVTGAGIVERQTHDKLCYHFKKGMCKGWYCKNCHTYSWK